MGTSLNRFWETLEEGTRDFYEALCSTRPDLIVVTEDSAGEKHIGYTLGESLRKDVGEIRVRPPGGKSFTRLGKLARDLSSQFAIAGRYDPRCSVHPRHDQIGDYFLVDASVRTASGTYPVELTVRQNEVLLETAGREGPFGVSMRMIGGEHELLVRCMADVCEEYVN
jgi:hypothetical protein